MSVIPIALTSANESAMKAAAEALLTAAAARKVQIAVVVGVDTALDAEAVYRSSGELWRIGADETRPELDFLVDRWLEGNPGTIRHDVHHALDQFLCKPRIAA